MENVARRLSIGMALTGLLLLTAQILSGEGGIPKDIQVKKNPVASSDSVLASARKAYADNCLQCHGETGKGDGLMAGMLKERPADLTNVQLVGGMTDGELFWAITKGSGKVMPPFESKLNETERWSLVNFLRTISKTESNNTPRPGRD